MTLLEVRRLSKHFETKAHVLKAVQEIHLTVAKGEIVGVVGESGCGKTTLGRLVISLCQPTSGEILFKGRQIAGLSSPEKLTLRKEMQMVFQDPYSALNPLMTIEKILAEPLDIHQLGTRRERAIRVRELLESVHLEPDFLNKYPHQCSGGQRQRIGIARALATSPEFVVLDEPVSALDAQTQQQILRLFLGLKQKLNFSALFITHDLGILRSLADRIAVMYAGRIVECAPTELIFSQPAHPYTKALLSCIPSVNLLEERTKQRIILKGDPPDPFVQHKGCCFSERCPLTALPCQTSQPQLRRLSDRHEVACLLQSEPSTQNYFQGC